MTAAEIQKLLDNPKDFEIHLPSGEFEGNFVINSSCVVFGDSTVLLCSRGTALTINSPGTQLNSLRIESAGTALRTVGETSFNDVEIDGRIIGLCEEEGYFGIPDVIDAGKIPAEKEVSVSVRLNVPCAARFISDTNTVTLSKTDLSAGENTVIITISPIKNRTVLYTELFIETAVKRRIFVSGEASDEISSYENGKLIFEPEPEPDFYDEPAVLYPEDGEDTDEDAEDILLAPMPYEDESKAKAPLIIERGMTVKLEAASAQIEFLYDNSDFPMEVDAFAFMLEKNGEVTSNDRFVFFGNDHSFDGGVKLLNAPDKKVFHIDFRMIPDDVSEIDIAYSIYKNPMGLNFSDLVHPAVSIKLSDGKDFIFILPEPLNVGTIVGLELIRDKDGFKANPLGMIYPRGLEDLCSNYGLKIL